MRQAVSVDDKSPYDIPSASKAFFGTPRPADPPLLHRDLSEDSRQGRGRRYRVALFQCRKLVLGTHLGTFGSLVEPSIELSGVG